MYENLVFKGGGAKIFCSVGAIKALEDFNILSDIKRVSGASAGAVLALLVSLNMSANEIKDYLLDFDMSSEMNANNIKAETVRFFEEFGRYSGDDIINQTRDLILKKTGNPDITFKQLHNHYLGFKDLYVTVTDLTNNKSIMYSHEDTPNAKVLDAVRASSAYPLYVIPVRGPNGEYLTDGGLLNNYPISVFDQPKFLTDPNLDYNPKTIGIYLGSLLENGMIIEKTSDIIQLLKPFNGMDQLMMEEYVKRLNIENFNISTGQINDICSYIRRMLDVGSTAKPHIHHEQGEIFIDLDGINVSTFDLDISREKRLELIEHGEKQTLEYIYLDKNGELVIASHNLVLFKAECDENGNQYYDENYIHSVDNYGYAF